MNEMYLGVVVVGGCCGVGTAAVLICCERAGVGGDDLSTVCTVLENVYGVHGQLRKSLAGVLCCQSRCQNVRVLQLLQSLYLYLSLDNVTFA